MARKTKASPAHPHSAISAAATRRRATRIEKATAPTGDEPERPASRTWKSSWIECPAVDHGGRRACPSVIGDDAVPESPERRRACRHEHDRGGHGSAPGRPKEPTPDSPLPGSEEHAEDGECDDRRRLRGNGKDGDGARQLPRPRCAGLRAPRARGRQARARETEGPRGCEPQRAAAAGRSSGTPQRVTPADRAGDGANEIPRRDAVPPSARRAIPSRTRSGAVAEHESDRPAAASRRPAAALRRSSVPRC